MLSVRSVSAKTMKRMEAPTCGAPGRCFHPVCTGFAREEIA